MAKNHKQSVFKFQCIQLKVNKWNVFKPELAFIMRNKGCVRFMLMLRYDLMSSSGFNLP